MKRPTLILYVVAAVLGTQSVVAADAEMTPIRPAQPKSTAPPVRWEADRVAAFEEPIATSNTLSKVDPSLLVAKGQVTVVVRLKDAPLASAVGPNAKRVGPRLTPTQQRAYSNRLLASHNPIVNQVSASSGSIVAHLTKVLNAVIVNVDASALPSLARVASVATIRPVGNYQMDLSETVPYIGAAALQSNGIDGTDTTVAVLDSGVDYTHRNLGGPGTTAAYVAAYGDDPSAPQNKSRDGLFPTAKVVEGYDFVGEKWPNGELEPDPDPIDFQSHGTHVADIIGGKSLDGTHKGVAPGTKLLAYKVCSAVSTACSGVAILQGLEAAADPNGDGSIADAADVVNMSLGSAYGQIQDDSAGAVQNLVDLGVVVVCSAGNNGDRPYIVGSPSIAPGAISVAQTHVPSAKVLSVLLTGVPGSPVEIRNTASIDWAPVAAEVCGQVVKAGPDNTNLLCSLPTAGSLAGKVVLIDRGGCNISFKVHYASHAGAVAVLLANNAPGDPPSFSYGGAPPDTTAPLIPTIVITQADGHYIKSRLTAGDTVSACLSPSQGTALAGSVVSSSSRGPAPSSQGIKPDIAAPGASLSAEVGTGTGETAFGGTSGAAPMVSGAAALVLDAFPALAPHQVRARLMNTAEKDILVNPLTLPGVLAPITRIGAGEVRVNKAVEARSIAYDRDTKAGSLSFGYRPINGGAAVTQFRRSIEICNLGSESCTYAAANTFRYADDEASGAVSVSFTPSSVTVPAGGKGQVRVTLSMDGSKLPEWTLNGGTEGGNGELLRALEYDGYVVISGTGDQTLSVPWQILPRKAADVRPDAKTVVLTGDPGEETGTFRLRNPLGARDGTTEVFDLLGTSPLDYPTPAPAGANYALVDLKSFGARVFMYDRDPYIQFAVATYGEPAHPNYPSGVEVDLDTNGDGNIDYAVFHEENGGFGLSGQNVTRVYSIATGKTVSTFYTDSDLNAGVTILTLPLSALGLLDLGYPLQMAVWGYDNYFTGLTTDLITDGGFFILYTPGVPRFYVNDVSGGFGLEVGVKATVNVPVAHFSFGDDWSPSHTGFLLVHRQAATKRWTDEVRASVP